MSCGPCDEKAREREVMTRGKFLGLGATAAAGVGAIGVGAQEARPEELGPQERVPCGSKPTRCGPNAGRDWAVSASVLQVLWGELFPRMVGYNWRIPWPHPFPLGALSPAQLNAAIGAFMADSFGGGSDPTTQFAKRVKLVTDYFGDGTISHIPVRYWGAGRFDFILSDFGLDLFAPMRPQSEAEMLHFYQIRSAGRPTIGIPRYLDSAEALAFDVHAPTGPSQIWTDVVGEGTPVGVEGCRLGQLTCLETTAPGDFPDANVRPPEGREPFAPTKKFSIDGFATAVSKVRCWQLQGAVYRGVLEQLPRVVATVWHEHYTSASPANYMDRWFNGDIRGIFMDRMETWLPEPSQMVFDADPSVTDVTITNRGLLFPQLTDPRTASHGGTGTPGIPLPSWSDMVTSISMGGAGNPVFTDSRRPPRDI